MGGYYKGRRLAEVTESLIEYTTFESLPKRLNEVFPYREKKNIALDKPARFPCPIRNSRSK
jgi:hypothetical protein